MRKVALVINTDKPLAVAAGANLVTWLQHHSIHVMVEPRGAMTLGREELAVPALSDWGQAELLIVLGGDGTLLRAAVLVAPMGVPILGINTGHLGFLTEMESAEMFEHLEEVLEGRYVVEERMMLTAWVERLGEPPLMVMALNDAVISKGPRARLVHLAVGVGETLVASYPADGVIISTPTGSTAYSLSAGGPVVAPTVDVLLVTPICPHTMNSRAIVLAGSEQVKVEVVDTRGEVGLSADGSDPVPLYKGDVVRVQRAPFNTRLVRRHSYRFYEVLRRKLSHEEG